MKFYYTGASNPGVNQGSPAKSLGGNISGTIVPNNSLNNIFDVISTKMMQEPTFEVRAIVLRNTTGAAVNNVYLYHTYGVSDVKAKIEWSPVTIPNGKSMEEIGSGNSEPYQISEWFEPIGEDDKILIASQIPVDGVLGLWIKRTPVSPDPLDAVPDQDLEAYLVSLSNSESVVVSIDYT